MFKTLGDQFLIHAFLHESMKFLLNQKRDMLVGFPLKCHCMPWDAPPPPLHFGVGGNKYLLPLKSPSLGTHKITKLNKQHRIMHLRRNVRRQRPSDHKLKHFKVKEN